MAIEHKAKDFPERRQIGHKSLKSLIKNRKEEIKSINLNEPSLTLRKLHGGGKGWAHFYCGHTSIFIIGFIYTMWIHEECSVELRKK